MNEDQITDHQPIQPGKLQSLKELGFRMEPWAWVFAFCGAVLRLVNREEVWNFEAFANQSQAIGYMLGGFTTSFLFLCGAGVIGDYVAWRWISRTRQAKVIGALIGVATVAVPAIAGAQ